MKMHDLTYRGPLTWDELTPEERTLFMAGAPIPPRPLPREPQLSPQQRAELETRRKRDR